VFLPTAHEQYSSMQKKVATLHSGGARRFFAYVTAALVFGFSFLPDFEEY
jgi:hypothetical protein